MNIVLLKQYLKENGMPLKEISKYAVENTEFYKEFYDKCNLEDYASLPLFTKYDLIDKSPYDLLSKEFKDRYFCMEKHQVAVVRLHHHFLQRMNFINLLKCLIYLHI